MKIRCINLQPVLKYRHKGVIIYVVIFSIDVIYKKGDIIMRSKKIITALLTGVFTASFSLSAFAGNWLDLTIGWQYDKTGMGGLAHDEWLWIDGNKDGIAECYYFDGTGFMWHDREKDGYVLNSDGQWIVDGVVQTKQVEIDNSETSDLM